MKVKCRQRVLLVVYMLLTWIFCFSFLYLRPFKASRDAIYHAVYRLMYPFIAVLLQLVDVTFRSDDDVLNNISVLEDLFKVSNFQVYKNLNSRESAQNAKGEIDMISNANSSKTGVTQRTGDSNDSLDPIRAANKVLETITSDNRSSEDIASLKQRTSLLFG